MGGVLAGVEVAVVVAGVGWLGWPLLEEKKRKKKRRRKKKMKRRKELEKKKKSKGESDGD